MDRKYLKISKILVIIFLSCYPVNKTLAAYTPKEGRISYLSGIMINTNFQETLFNNNDSHSNFGRSQSFALLLQALGDLNSKGSLMAEITLGIHKFSKETELYIDEYKFEAISFDLGYRRNVGGDFWMSAQLGSLYPWRVTQKLSSQPFLHSESEFSSLYSVVVGVQYESELFDRPLSYDLRIRKYVNSYFNDQMAIGVSIGFRFLTLGD